MASLQAWIVAALVFMFVAAVTFLAIAVFVVVVTAGRVNAAKKKADQALACYVQPQLDRAEKTLPTVSYYRHHPAELRAQLELIHDQRQQATAAWGVCELRDP